MQGSEMFLNLICLLLFLICLVLPMTWLTVKMSDQELRRH